MTDETFSTSRRVPPVCLTSYTDESEDEDDNPIARLPEHGGSAVQFSSKFAKRSRMTPGNDIVRWAEDGDRKLPLPSAVCAMFKTTSQRKEAEEDPSIHGGRIRSFAHVRGNWASFVYIPFTHNETLQQVLNMIQRQQHSNPELKELQINADLHLSLTKTQVFRYHWIDPFKDSLNRKLKSHKPFDLAFNEFEVYVNEEKTRTFLGLEVYPSKNLLKLIEDCDGCLSEYGLEPYYDDPSYHVSLAWMVGNQEEKLKKILVSSIAEEWNNLCDKEPDIKYSNITRIAFKTGSDIYELVL